MSIYQSLKHSKTRLLTGTQHISSLTVQRLCKQIKPRLNDAQHVNNGYLKQYTH